jgi:hypothetical protein
MVKDDPFSLRLCVTRRLGEAMSEQTHTREVQKLPGSFSITIGMKKGGL